MSVDAEKVYTFMGKVDEKLDNIVKTIDAHIEDANTEHEKKEVRIRKLELNWARVLAILVTVEIVGLTALKFIPNPFV